MSWCALTLQQTHGQAPVTNRLLRRLQPLMHDTLPSRVHDHSAKSLSRMTTYRSKRKTDATGKHTPEIGRAPLSLVPASRLGGILLPAGATGKTGPEDHGPGRKVTAAGAAPLPRYALGVGVEIVGRSCVVFPRSVLGSGFRGSSHSDYTPNYSAGGDASHSCV